MGQDFFLSPFQTSVGMQAVSITSILILSPCEKTQSLDFAVTKLYASQIKFKIIINHKAEAICLHCRMTSLNVIFIKTSKQDYVRFCPAAFYLNHFLFIVKKQRGNISHVLLCLNWQLSLQYYVLQNVRRQILSLVQSQPSLQSKSVQLNSASSPGILN